MRKKSYFIAGLVSVTLLMTMPAELRCELASYYDAPDTVFAGDVAIDIIEHNGGIWFATGEGLSFTYDTGNTWLLYRSSNGLVSNNLSALFSIDGRLWIGTNHEVTIGDELITMSDGISYTDNDGDLWTQVDFDALGFEGAYSLWGVDRTVYDFTGYDNVDDPAGLGQWRFFAAFAGGMLASRDGGTNWRRIFPSRTDSINFFSGLPLNYANRAFSCVADTSHGDSLYLWSGTASGLFQYVFALPREKQYAAKRVNAIAFSDVATNDKDNYLFYAGDVGVARGLRIGGPYISRFANGDPNGATDGLPGAYISSIIVVGGKVLVGTVDGAGGFSTGLAVSTDMGDSYQAQSSFTDVIGAYREISDFVTMGSRLYLAAEEAGLFVSADTGQSWTHMWVDASDTATTNRRNVVRALHAYHDTLRVGTDSGLVTLYLDASGTIDSSFNNVFPEDDSSSTVVVLIEVEEFYHPIDSTYDSLCIWTVNRPLTDSGELCIQRSIGDDDRTFMDQQHQVGVVTYDMDFMGDSVFVAGEYGVRFSRDGENGLRNQTFTHEIVDNTKSPSDRIDEEVTVFEVHGDTILVGSKEGFAISYDRGDNYIITRVNQDTLAADVVLSYTSSLAGISGNFMPAVGVQDQVNEPAAVWVSTRPTFSGSVGISVGLISSLVDTSSVPWDTTYFREFAKAYDDGFAWNFAFKADSVFAATDDGLLFNCEALGATWDTLEFVSSTGRVVVESGTPVYAVEVIGDDVWVGTDDGLVRMRPSGSSWVTGDVYQFIDSTTAPDVVYAYPVPWSRSLSASVRDDGRIVVVDGITFHFVVEEDAYITVEVYDFAMNLVRRVIDNRFFAADNYHLDNFGNTWDGRNGAGEEVAVGIYHFKVEYSTGEVRWGKLAVIP